MSEAVSSPLQVSVMMAVASWNDRISASRTPEIVRGMYPGDKGFNNKIALTFDDGVRPETDIVLTILKRHNIKATFFIVGWRLLRPDGSVEPHAARILRRIVAEGHTIGNHSYGHDIFSRKKYQGAQGVHMIERDLRKVQNAVDRALGYSSDRTYPVKYYRPPGGDRGHGGKRADQIPGNFDRAVERLGGQLINWQINSGDYCMYPHQNGCPKNTLTSSAVEQRVFEGVQEYRGGVVLFHDTPLTVKILPSILDRSKRMTNERGHFSFSTLDEVMAIKYRRTGSIKK